jgi:hypothetical protein
MNMGSDPRRRLAADESKPDLQQIGQASGITNQSGALPVGGSLKELSDTAHSVRREFIDRGKSDNDGQGQTAEALMSRRMKLENVIQRLASGYYDLPEIKQKIADTFADDIL